MRAFLKILWCQQEINFKITHAFWKSNQPNLRRFYNQVSRSLVPTEFKKLDTSKTTQLEGIALKIVTKNLNVCAAFLVKNVNKHIRMEESSDKLKTADITLAFKKGGEHNKSNYRPVSALPILTKVYEKCLYKHIENYMENVLILDVVSERILIQHSSL